MMPMTFEVSSRVTLLFDVWDVDGPTGMLLSVCVVFLMTVFYELLKAWRISLGNRPAGAQYQTPLSLASPYSPPSSSSSSECHKESNAATASSASQSSLVHKDLPPNACCNGWLLHGVQTALHMLQVSLGYLLMLCVMSYNTWIFLGVILGSALGYFIAFPLLRHV